MRKMHVQSGYSLVLSVSFGLAMPELEGKRVI